MIRHFSREREQYSGPGVVVPVKDLGACMTRSVLCCLVRPVLSFDYSSDNDEAFHDGRQMIAERKFDLFPEPEIYALVGINPEIHAYAMARYSRSGLSMREALRELSKQKAEQFLETFYFQYGHRSIADLAHLSFAVENISMLAAIAVVDEQRWDGQERSSRYQDFRKSGYHIPSLPDGLRHTFVDTVERLLQEYETLSAAAFQYFSASVPRPQEMPEGTYKRTLRARAFDVARYLLPLATLTSVGQITNARTLENQISRLASALHSELRLIASLLAEAAKKPPYDLRLEEIKAWVGDIQKLDQSVKVNNVELFANQPVAPTLVKYAAAREYDAARRAALSQAARELLEKSPVGEVKSVTLVQPKTLEVELAATLIYEHSHHPYEEIVRVIESLSAARRAEVIDLGVKHRGLHDEVSRAYAAGLAFQFDVLTNIGAFRDLHRHRRCIQILQAYSAMHGYEIPAEVKATGREEAFHSLMRGCRSLWDTIHDADEDIAPNADYVLPMAFRRRALFKMDLAEVIYICELRTQPAGHFSYRCTAHEMYERVKESHPDIARHIKVHDVSYAADFLKR
jgi:thymidylate synthase ThyX